MSWTDPEDCEHTIQGHDRGRVLVDVAVMLADGGEASPTSTCCATKPRCWDRWPQPRRCGGRWTRPRWHGCARSTSHGPGCAATCGHSCPKGCRPAKVAGTDLGEVVVLDVDATFVVAHSEKEHAAPTYKGTFGFHPLGVWCDNTTELLAAGLRAGNAGANTAADHIEVLTAAIAQIPATHRKTC